MHTIELGNNFFLVTAKAPADLSSKNQTQDKSKKIINYGDKNLYPQDLIQCIESSPTATACIETHSKFLYGDGLIFAHPSEQETPFMVWLKRILNDDFFQNTCYDFSFLETVGWRLRFNLLGEITNICHQDVSTIRLGVPNADGDITFTKLSANWADLSLRENKDILIDLYNEILVKEKIASFHKEEIPAIDDFKKWTGAVDYVRRYKPGQIYYTKPKLASALKWIYADGKIQNYHANNVDNAFTPSVIVYVPYSLDGVDEKGRSKKQVFKDDLNKNLMGTENTGPTVITGPGRDPSGKNTGAPEIIPFSANNNHELYISISELIRNHICTATQVPPELAGIETPGKLGGTQEIINKAELYQNTVIKHDQNKLVSRLNYLIKRMAGYDGTTISISNSLPIRYVPDQVVDLLDPAVLLAYYGFDPVKDLKGAANV